MSCLSCKTNRYLINIYKSQQRVTVPQPLPIPSFPALLPPPCSPEVCIVTRESRSDENLGGSISSCPRKAFQNLARKVNACRKFARYSEDGTWKAARSNDASSMPVGLQETDRQTYTHTHTAHTIQQVGWNHCIWPSANPASRFQEGCSWLYQRVCSWLQWATAGGFFSAELTCRLCLQKTHVCTYTDPHTRTQENRNPGTGQGKWGGRQQITPEEFTEVRD